jgi:hypothetical protein
MRAALTGDGIPKEKGWKDQSTWPAHLRDDAPYQRCDRCGRKTWDTSEFGGGCIMPQTYSAIEGWYNPVWRHVPH